MACFSRKSALFVLRYPQKPLDFLLIVFPDVLIFFCPAKTGRCFPKDKVLAPPSRQADKFQKTATANRQMHFPAL